MTRSFVNIIVNNDLFIVSIYVLLKVYVYFRRK